MQQHEFKTLIHSEMAEKQYKCLHCECVEVWDAIEGIFYMAHKDAGYPYLLRSDMPPCVTRKTNEHETDEKLG